MCRQELIRHDITVHVVGETGQWYHGRLSEPQAPSSFPTSGQVKYMRFADTKKNRVQKTES